MDLEPKTYKPLRTSDMRFVYQREGSGPSAIVLLHGWPQTSRAWRRVVPLLSAACDVVTLDMPGFGYSSKPESGFDKKTIARRIRELVQALGLSRVALVGHDIGGHVAYAYAAQWPDEVSHFIFIESSLPGFGQEKAMDVAQGGSWHFGFNMAGDIAEDLVRGRERLFVDYVMRRDKVGLYDPNAVSMADIDFYAEALARPGALRSSMSYYRTLPDDRVDNRAWGKTLLQIPALAIGAEWGYGQASAETLRQVARNVQDTLVEHSGHYIPEERPEELAAILLDFLKH